MRKPRSYNSVEDALADTARLYRKSLWNDAESYVEVWCEKDALAGVIYPITANYDVPLMVARGFSSETFCYEAIAARDGDHRDPTTSITSATSIAPAKTPRGPSKRS